MNKQNYTILFLIIFFLSTKNIFAYGGSNLNIQILPITECSDGIDNDSDGLIDFPSDGGCESLIDNSELIVPVSNTGSSGGGNGGGGGQIVNVVIGTGLDKEKSGTIKVEEIPKTFFKKIQKKIRDFVVRNKKPQISSISKDQTNLFDVSASPVQKDDNSKVVKKRSFFDRVKSFFAPVIRIFSKKSP